MTEEQELPPQTARRWLGVVGIFVAPTTLITGLCYFFGAVATRERLRYFAVDPQSLGFTTTDYVVMNVKLMFFPLVRLLLVFVIVVWAAVVVHRLTQFRRHRRVIRAFAWLATAVALVSLGISISWLLFEAPELRSPNLIASLIGGGTGLLVAGYWMLSITRNSHDAPARRFPTAERMSLGIAAAVMVAALFWLADTYAAEFGHKLGQHDAGEIWADDTGVLLNTKEPLDIPAGLADLVKITRVQSDDPGAAITYRYECLRKIELRANRWVLVPAKWKHDKGFALTITPEASNRIVTRPVDASVTGNNPNVSPYWQCPEVVPHFEESDLEPMLLGPDEISGRLGVEKLSSATAPAFAGEDQGSPASNDCARVADPDPAAAFRDSGFIASRGMRLVSGDPTQGLVVDENVWEFENASKASEFIINTVTAWLNCQHAVVDVRNGTVVEKQTLGGAGVVNDIDVLDSSIPAVPLRNCSHAIAAKSNVVVDVHLCGTRNSAAAVPLVSQIRDNIPTDLK
jgi:hypothetical protein